MSKTTMIALGLGLAVLGYLYFYLRPGMAGSLDLTPEERAMRPFQRAKAVRARLERERGRTAPPPPAHYGEST